MPRSCQAFSGLARGSTEGRDEDRAHHQVHHSQRQTCAGGGISQDRGEQGQQKDCTGDIRPCRSRPWRESFEKGKQAPADEAGKESGDESSCESDLRYPVLVHGECGTGRIADQPCCCGYHFSHGQGDEPVPNPGACGDSACGASVCGHEGTPIAYGMVRSSGVRRPSNRDRAKESAFQPCPRTRSPLSLPADKAGLSIPAIGTGFASISHEWLGLDHNCRTDQAAFICPVAGNSRYGLPMENKAGRVQPGPEVSYQWVECDGDVMEPQATPCQRKPRFVNGFFGAEGQTVPVHGGITPPQLRDPQTLLRARDLREKAWRKRFMRLGVDSEGCDFLTPGHSSPTKSLAVRHAADDAWRPSGLPPRSGQDGYGRHSKPYQGPPRTLTDRPELVDASRYGIAHQHRLLREQFDGRGVTELLLPDHR
ncbi:hypothetical protein S1361_30000 [Streptomyces cyanogenus]|uniref:Uncharacterized protein n=1 Tax=Streptomyces cyanogenus TaxID=80860 RepID=A0ABX7TXU2_STRCY|nr:hypothetical protein S1361_30000 [Streptomyces cyanogenus]